MLKLPTPLLRGILHFNIASLAHHVPYDAKVKFLAPRYPREVLLGQKGHDLVRKRISDRSPLMVSRFGSVELLCLSHYLKYRQAKKPYTPQIRNSISQNAGVFPSTDEALDKFSEMFLEHARNIDVLGVWFNPYEDVLAKKTCKSADLVELGCLEPFWFQQPWSALLEGRKVLVVHPFSDSIQSQYKQKRQLLFRDKSILPDFELRTVKAVQSLGNTDAGFPTWFDAYRHMCDEISRVDFDFCVIGAGAYGLPLASFVKQMGRQAFHLGGSTQILFGIKGRRWEREYADTTATLFNEHWVRPLPSETPPNKDIVEDGCYW